MNKRQAIRCLYLALWGTLFSAPAQAGTLAQLYQASLRHFPSLKGFESTERSLQIERSSLTRDRFFNLNGEAGFSGYRPSSGPESGRGVLFTLSDDLDLFHKQRPAEEKVGGELQKNALDAALERQSLFEQVSEHYYDLAHARGLEKVLQEDQAWIEQNLSLAIREEKAGFLPAIEVNRWQLERLDLLNRIRTNQEQITQEEGSLQVLTGLERIPTEDLSLPPDQSFSEKVLLQGSPEIALFAAEKQSLLLDRKVVADDWLPSFQLKSSVDTTPVNRDQAYTVGLSMTFHPLHGGKDAAIASLDAQLERLEFEKQAKEAQLADSFRNRIRSLRFQRENLQSLQVARKLSQDNFDRLSQAYHKRYVDFLHLSDARQKQVALQENTLDVLAELCKNQARLTYLQQGDY